MKQLFSRTFRLDHSPDLAALASPADGFTWLSPGTSFAGRGELIRFSPVPGPRRFAQTASTLAELFGAAQIEDEVDLPGTGPLAFGSFTFDSSSVGSTVVVPSVVDAVGEDASWRTVLSLEQMPDSADVTLSASQAKTRSLQGDLGPWAEQLLETGEQAWQADVAALRQAIREGLVQKVVLARMVEAKAERWPDRQAIIRQLNDRYPECFTFALDGWIGASPELLVRRLGNVVDSIPLAGSAPRGASDHEDHQIGMNLKSSAKDLMEHRLTVDSVLNGLSGLCDEIQFEPEPSLLLLANVQHLATKVQGRLSSPLTSLELAGALHPTAAVCGVPSEDALRLIRTIEGFDRGRYAGPVGWMDHHGDGEWAIALRCAEIGEGWARVFAGAGIVEGSKSHEEFVETELKLRPILDALGVQGGSVPEE